MAEESTREEHPEVTRLRKTAMNCCDDIQEIKQYINNVISGEDPSAVSLAYRLGIIACYLNDVQDELKKSFHTDEG